MNDTECAYNLQSEDPIYRLLQPLLPGFGRFRVGVIQRQFMIGYNRASRLLEMLEKSGLIVEVPDKQVGYFVASPRTINTARRLCCGTPCDQVHHPDCASWRCGAPGCVECGFGKVLWAA